MGPAGYLGQRPLILRTRLRDCLYLNWALPARVLGTPPDPLRYERHLWRGEDHVFASAVLVRLERLHFPGLRRLRLSYPQLNLRLYVLDGEDVPSVLFRRMFVPLWVLPAARLIARHPASPAWLAYPRTGHAATAAGERRWRVRGAGGLEVSVRPGGPELGEGPNLGRWEETVAYFQQRPRGYAVAGGRLRQVRLDQAESQACPVRVEELEGGLLERLLDDGELEAWPRLHSAWLSPEIAAELELLPRREAPVARQVPAPG